MLARDWFSDGKCWVRIGLDGGRADGEFLRGIFPDSAGEMYILHPVFFISNENFGEGFKLLNFGNF